MALNSLTAKAASSANVDVTVYTVPADKQFANISLNLTNNGATVSTVRVAITNAANPSLVDYIEYNLQLPASGGSLRRTNLVLSPTEIS